MSPIQRRVAEEIKFRIQYLQDEEQKRVLSELVNVLISKDKTCRSNFLYIKKQVRITIKEIGE